VRVVAGEWGGRKLVTAPGATTRPTSDRVREATFNALESAGVVDGAAVLDLFAGSGALGIEALSRGAARVTFVERDRTALAALRTNLEHLGAGPEQAEVVIGDGVALLAGATGRLTGPWDLALLDPPYAFAGWVDLLGGLDAEVAVCESAAEVEAPDGWQITRSKRYGGTVVTIVRRSTSRNTRGDDR
jgi:16S rRNA (guanine966-N2)-methyltransferase